MVKLKKLSFILLSSVLAFSALIGCSSVNQGTDRASATGDKPGRVQAASDILVPEEEAKLVVWESKGKDIDVLRKIADAFTAEYGIPVRVEEVDQGEQIGKLTTDGPAGLGADVVTFPHDQLGNAVATGLIVPNEFFEEETKAEFLDNAVRAVSMNGMVYGYPKYVETYALFYNKDLVGEAPATFDEVIAYAKENTDAKNNKFGFMWDVGNFYFSYPFLSGFGGYVFKDGIDPDDMGLNNEGAVEGAKFLQSLKEILPLNAGDINNDIKTSLFSEGKLGLNIDGPWAVGTFKSAGVNFGVVPLPTLPNGEHPKSFSGVRAWYVNAYTKYPKAARLFARYATSKKNLEMAYHTLGSIPARKDLEELVAKDEISMAFLEQFKHSSPMPSIPQMNAVWDPAKAALGTIWNNGRDPKAALDEAVEQIKQGMKK